MNSILNYLWEGSICLFLLFGFYRILLAKLTFFGLNRIYLMLALGMVLIIPMLSLQTGFSPDATFLSVNLIYLLPEFELSPDPENQWVSFSALSE